MPALFARTCLLSLLLTGFAHADGRCEVPEGFTPLFNGKDLEGWHGGSTADPRKITEEQQAQWDAEVPKHWSVDGHELVSDGHGPHVRTKELYGDFELWVDWRLSPNGDSGVYLRDCPQVQLWDPANKEAHQHGSDKGSGALWNNQTHDRFPTEVADRPTGEWNRMHVEMVGEYVTVTLNDKKVVDRVVLENYFDRSIPVFKEGAIHLQTHGSETRFRNVFVRRIPAEEANNRLSQLGDGDQGFQPLFNGKSLAGWTGATDSFEIVDGALQFKKGASGNLLTEKEYADFVVRMEFKLPPGGNNGLAIRAASAEADPAYNAMEIQVLDDSPEHYPDLQRYQSHGSVYGLAPATRGYLRPAGEWNYQETVVDGDHVEVHLNGFKINDVDLSKVREKPIDGKSHPGASRESGHFGFSGHHDPVAFRNIRIKTLD